jgi:hypothetical protein
LRFRNELRWQHQRDWLASGGNGSLMNEVEQLIEGLKKETADRREIERQLHAEAKTIDQRQAVRLLEAASDFEAVQQCIEDLKKAFLYLPVDLDGWPRRP